MNHLKTLLQFINEVHETPENLREVIKKGAGSLAKAYATDLFRAADFVVNVTNGVSTDAVLKLLAPNSIESINKTNEAIKALEDKATSEAIKSQASPGFTLNPKPSPIVMPSARD
jgi:uncharacterized protein (UPF0147 family)